MESLHSGHLTGTGFYISLHTCTHIIPVELQPEFSLLHVKTYLPPVRLSVIVISLCSVSVESDCILDQFPELVTTETSRV